MADPWWTPNVFLTAFWVWSIEGQSELKFGRNVRKFLDEIFLLGVFEVQGLYLALALEA